MLFCHEHAFVDTPAVLAVLAARLGPAFRAVSVPADEVSYDDAVATYLFNSQLLPRADGRFVLIAPADVGARPRVAAYLERLAAGDGPIAEVKRFDLRESMANGGGPACLRLRVHLTAAERAAVGPRVWLDDALAADLDAWIGRHYRDRLVPGDLADPALLDESRRALDELTALLRLPPVYPFQLG